MYYRSKIDFFGFTKGKLYKIKRVQGSQSYFLNNDLEERTCTTSGILNYFELNISSTIPKFYYRLKSTLYEI